MDGKDTKDEQQTIQKLIEEIVWRIARAVPSDGSLEFFPGSILTRVSKPTETLKQVFEPAFCLIAQGSKQAQLGEDIFRYDPYHYMIHTVDLPLIFRIDGASPEKPYLGFRLILDPSIVSSLIIESDIKIIKGAASAKAMDVDAVDAELLDAVTRLIRLVEKPREQKVLAPLITREIVFRLLVAGQGPRLAYMLSSGDTQRISKAIGLMRERFDEPLPVETIARELGMSVTVFHHHFKSVTAMSPLQYQKHIRLQEARRLMLSESLDAASAGFRVGYEDPSYFSRDYKKHFGAPPQRDIARLRSSVSA
jgi:AraC-like DNA-binding protein